MPARLRRGAHRRFSFLICLVTWVAIGVPIAITARAADHVIHISVDGLNARMMQEVIDAGQAPNFKRFQDEGAWTNNARTDFTHTNTLPNHTTMLTGRPVLQPEGLPNTVHHGYTLNDRPILKNLHQPSNSDTLFGSGRLQRAVR